jgi:hypothetical protein
MKNITLGLIFISLSTFSFGSNVSTPKKETKSKINSYIKGKSCLQARKTLMNNGWKPHSQNRDEEALDYQKAVMQKYPEIESCSPTGYGECTARYKKGSQYLTLTYAADGGSSFESKECFATDFNLSNTLN